MNGYVKFALFIAVVFLGISISLPLHEYGHYVVGTAFGLQGTIYFDHVTFTTTPDVVQVVVIRLAGGLIAGAELLALMALSRKPYGYGFLVMAVTNFIYAPFDSVPGSQLLGTIVASVTFLTISIYLVHTGQFDDDLTMREHQ